MNRNVADPRTAMAMTSAPAVNYLQGSHSQSKNGSGRPTQR
jgi:hypothetical protein